VSAGVVAAVVRGRLLAGNVAGVACWLGEAGIIPGPVSGLQPPV
jgi:hypothetical protein